MEKEDAAGVGEDEEQGEKPCREDTPGPMPEHQYSREELFKIGNSKLSRVRPSCLDKTYDTLEGLWDPEKWYRALCGGSRENSPLTVMDGRDRDRRRPHDLDRDLLLGRNRKTSSSDPRERVKEEQDGIVLSPQRRNFSTGCQVSKTSSGLGGGSLYRQSSLNDYKERDDRDRDRRDQRRIGSGRIQIDRDQGRDREREYHRYDRDDRDRDRDRGDRDRDRDRMDRELLDRDRNRMDRDRDRRYTNERSERFRRDNRDFGEKMAERRDRDFRDRERDRDDRRYDRGGRRRHHVEEETPEWFTGGPTSQNDTIELRGFEREGSNKTNRQRREVEEEEEEEEEVVEEEDGAEVEMEEYPVEEKPAQAEVDEAGDAKDSVYCQGECNGSLAPGEESQAAEVSAAMVGEQTALHPPFSSPALFDFNQFFNVEHIPGFGPVQDLLPDAHLEGQGLPDPVHSESGSRFSKWFSAQTAASEQAHETANHFVNSNINNNLLINHRNSPANLSDDFNYLNDILEGSKSPMGASPPLQGEQSTLGEKPFFHQFPINKDHLTHGPDHSAQHKNFTPIVSALFQNSALERSGNASTPSSRGSFSTQDAEAQLKAMLFGGARDSASSSGTASPANVPPGVQRKMKTVAELEADMHQNSPQSPASTPHSTPAPMVTSAPPPSSARNDDGDQSAFNRLLSMMKVGSGGVGPPVPRMPDQRSLSPSFGVQAHNEFTQALLRNREQQRQIQQQTLQSMQQPLPPSQLSSSPAQTQAQAQAQAQAEAQAQVQQLQQQLQQQHQQQQQQQQQQASLQAQGVMSKVSIIQHPGQQPPQQPPHIVVPRPVLPQGVGRVPQGQSQDPIINFLQQNPKIVMKPASPIPGMVAGHTSAQGPIPSPLPPGLPPPSIRVTSQQGGNPATARVPSPIMFSQQPPMHLSAPSPIHPVQLGPLAGQALSSNTLTFRDLFQTTSGMRSPVLQRVPSPQELKAHTQAIMQTALIKRKLEDQKERYLKKQQERDKSPSQPQPPTSAGKPITLPSTPTAATTTTTSQSKPANMAFTPTSVIRKMHSDRVTEKEKQAKESDEDSGEPSKLGTEKRGSESFEDSAMGSGEMGMETSDLPTPSSFNSNLSALSNQMEEALHLGCQEDSPLLRHDQDSLEDKVRLAGGIPIMGHVKGIPMIRSMVGQPVAPPASATGGRAIVKGSGEPVSAVPPAVLQPRPVTGGTQIPLKAENELRPIVGAPSSTGGGFDMSKLLEQQQQQQRLQQQTAVLPPHLAGPIPRPLGAGPAPPPPFMPITPGHIPLQAAATQASMQNAMIMQQISRVNAMNQLAALQAQQRMMDPRLQPLRTVIPTVNPTAPLSPLSPRSSLPSAISGLAPPNSSGVGISAAMKRSFSPAHAIFSQANKPVMNGPFSMGVPVSGVPNNSVPSEGEILKWFGPEVLKTQLPSMPPLPTHGTKVMTVDEIERS